MKVGLQCPFFDRRGRPRPDRGLSHPLFSVSACRPSHRHLDFESRLLYRVLSFTSLAAAAAAAIAAPAL